MKWPFANRIVRHREASPRVAASESSNLDLIDDHISAHLGNPNSVLHEIVSEYVHVDVHVVPPSSNRDFYTLVTSGMSDRPMNIPRQLKGKGFDRCELLVCMPSSWESDFGESLEKSWPVVWLVQLARFPHQYNTWFWHGHSLPNGDPAIPLSPETELCGWVLLEPKLVEDSFKCLVRKDGSRIFFHAAVPVYREEMAVKIRDGAEKFEELFAEHGITELIDPKRANVAATDEPTKQ